MEPRIRIDFELPFIQGINIDPSVYLPYRLMKGDVICLDELIALKIQNKYGEEVMKKIAGTWTVISCLIGMDGDELFFLASVENEYHKFDKDDILNNPLFYY